jgi:hypothetical protein
MDNLKMKQLSLLNFNGTTPSVRVPNEMMARYFPDVNGPLFCGVAHLRMAIYDIVYGTIHETVQRYLRSKGENTLYSDMANFLKETFDRKESGNLYETRNPEAYVMMLYFFRGDVDEHGNRGNIVYTSDIFYPIPVAQGGNLVSRFVLTFPVGLMFNKTEIVISYGEGDVKFFMLLSNLETLGLHKVVCGQPTMRMKSILLPTNRKSTQLTDAHVEQLISGQFKHPPGHNSVK